MTTEQIDTLLKVIAIAQPLLLGLLGVIVAQRRITNRRLAGIERYLGTLNGRTGRIEEWKLTASERLRLLENRLWAVKGGDN